jgi:osmoprotectant transport system substrate-binding protein
MRKHRWLMLLALLVVSLALTACGDDEGDGGGDAQQSGAIQRNEANSSTQITVGSKNFTEQKVLGEVYAQAIAAAGYDVTTELNLGDENTALKAIEGGEIDAYPEYTGTALLSFFGFQSDELPDDPARAFEEAKAGFAEKQLTAFDPTPFTSSNEVGVTKETANELNLKRISDLAEHDQDLTLYGTPECRQRLDCLLGLQQVYGLKFKKFTPVVPDLRDDVLINGQADVSIVFTTDAQNKREGFVLLEDDKGMFPPYNSTLVVRDEVVADAGGDLEDAVSQATRGLTVPVIQELNARVDLDKKTPKQVASEYLKETGLVE